MWEGERSQGTSPHLANHVRLAVVAAAAWAMNSSAPTHSGIAMGTEYSVAAFSVRESESVVMVPAPTAAIGIIFSISTPLVRVAETVKRNQKSWGSPGGASFFPRMAESFAVVHVVGTVSMVTFPS